MVEPRNLPFTKESPRSEQILPGCSVAELFELNIGLAHHMARRYHGGVEFDDRLQAAFVGLLKAARAFDLKRGTFAALATTCIRRELCSAADFQAGLPHSRRREVLYMHLATTRLSLELNRPATVDEVAADRGVEPDRVRWLRTLDHQPSELTADTEPAAVDDPSDRAVARVEAAAVRRAVARLRPREAMAVRLVYLAGQSMTAVGRRLGVSCEAIRRTVGRALDALRRDPDLVRLACARG